MPAGAESSAARSLDAALVTEQLRLLYAGLPVALGANIALGLVLAAVQWGTVDSVLLTGWLAMLGFVSVLRLLLALAERRARPHDPDRQAQWLWRFRLGALAAGAVWGAAGWLLFPAGDVPHQAFVSFVLAGIVAGAVTSLAVDRLAVSAFVLPALLSLIARLLVEGGPVAAGMALMVMLFLAFVTLSGKRLYDSLHENVRLRLSVAPREAALAESERRYRGLLESQTDVIVRADPEGRYTFVNDVFCRVFGLTREQAMGKMFLALVHEEDAPRTFELFQALLQPPHRLYHEFRCATVEGWRFYGFEGYAIRDEHGRITEVQASGRDITERRRVEDALRENQARLETAANIARLGYFRSDLRTGTLEWSDRLCRMLGFEPGEITPSFEYFVAGIAPQERERVMDVIGRAYSSTYPVKPGDKASLPTIEYLARRPDGQEFWLRTEAQAEVDESGRPVLVQGTVQDITGRKQAEEALREAHAKSRGILDAIPDLMLQLDEHGRFVDYHAFNVHDLAFPPELFMGKTVDEVMPEPVAARTREVLRRLAETDEVAVFEYSLPTVQGVAQDWEARFARVATGGTLIIIRNISERKKAENLKNEFISTVSHELRTPLTSICGSLGLLAGGVVDSDPEKARELIRIAHKNADRLSLLINDILDMEKIASGRMRLDLRPQPLMPLVEQALAVNRAYAEHLGVSLRLTGRVGEAAVNVDADRFQQVMANLLSNAAKFSPRGAAVDAAVTPCDTGLRISVSDRGPGIPEDFRPRVFDKFSQADASTTRSRGGSGLGLAISKEIVERMAGRIGFECREGGGTTFFVELPLVAQARTVTAGLNS